MKKIFLFLFLLISIGGYAQQESVNLTAVKTGKCYLEAATNKIRSVGVYESNSSLVLDYRPSRHGRITISSYEYYDLVSLLKNEGNFRLFEAKDNKENQKGVILIYQWKDGGIGYFAVGRCEIYIFEANGEGVYYDCYPSKD